MTDFFSEKDNYDNKSNFTEASVLEGERLDEIGFGDLKLIQKPEEFCYGVDAVILADFAAKYTSSANHKSYNNVKAVDLGTGTGIIPLVLSHKTLWNNLIGVEVQIDSYYRAVRNARLNGLESRMSFINGDVKDFDRTWGQDIKGCVDIVTSNPPYTQGTGGLKSSNAAKAIARHEITACLEDFIKCAAGLLKSKGDFFMVHRPSRLVDICCFARKYGLEPKEMCFVSANQQTAPNIILIHMVKGGGKQLKLLEPLFVYNIDNTYTDKLRECYR